MALRNPGLAPAVRARYHFVKTLLFWNISQRHANWGADLIQPWLSTALRSELCAQNGLTRLRLVSKVLFGQKRAMSARFSEKRCNAGLNSLSDRPPSHRQERAAGVAPTRTEPRARAATGRGPLSSAERLFGAPNLAKFARFRRPSALRKGPARWALALTAFFSHESADREKRRKIDQ